MSNFTSDFATRLRDVIEMRGVTQVWLADKSNTTEATISRYLTGNFKPSLEVVSNIAKALGVSVDYMVGISLNPLPYQEPDKDISILCAAYRRSDDARKAIIWTTLEPYLTPEEKTYISQSAQEGSTAG